MKQEKATPIWIKPATKEKLKQFGNAFDTQDDIINKIISLAKNNRKSELNKS